MGIDSAQQLVSAAKYDSGGCMTKLPIVVFVKAKGPILDHDFKVLSEWGPLLAA